MRPEAQRIAIATACGWEHIKEWTDGDPSGLPPTARARKEAKDSGGDPCVPLYLEDLNAMHEAFLSLKTHDRIRFHIHLEAVAKGKPDPKLGADFDYKVSNATAAQRAEAFLRALNLWTP